MKSESSQIRKTILQVAAALLLFGTPAAAQERIVVSLSDPLRPATVRAGVLNGGITVKVGDTKEVVVEARVRLDGEAQHGEDDDRRGRQPRQPSQRGSERDSRSGMKRIPMTAVGLTVEEQNNVVRIGTESINRTIDLTITVPRQTSLKLQSTNDGNIFVTGVEGELDVNNTNGDVTLTNVSGSVVTHALNGEIKVTMVRADAKPMSFSSLNGDIDVTLPADIKANVSMRTDNGEVLSDFDIQLQAASSAPVVEDSRGKGGKYRVKLDKTVRGTINGGGPEIKFHNFNGDILIRKAGAPR